MGRFETIATSLATVLVVAIICGAATYSCSTVNNQYYNAMNECVRTGGSAVPTGAGSNTALVCIRGNGAN